ncbi:MAG: hypothetical protein HOV96_14545 [Nonomuraea sp.]|nr:hypothetical protein [Nonomuraea sp.]
MNTADPIEFVVAALGPGAAAVADTAAFAGRLAPEEREAVRRLPPRWWRVLQRGPPSLLSAAIR